MSKEYDGFFKMTENLGAEMSLKRKEIQGNKDLSDSGRQRELEKLDGEYIPKIKDAQTRYHAQHSKDIGEYNKILNPPMPPSFKDRVVMKARRAPVMELEYIHEDERAAALIESNDAVVRALEKNMYMNVASRLDGEGFSKAIKSAFDSNDMTRLESLKEIASYRADELHAKAAGGYIDALRENNMQPRQKLARAHQKRLNLHKELFDWGVENVLSGKDFQDLRGRESDQAIQYEIDDIMRRMPKNEK